MLSISKQADYGLLILSLLKEKKEFIPLSQLVKTTKLPKRFLARIASILAKNKLIKSKEGKEGGYQLLKGAMKITLYDYLKIFEGNVCLTDCCDRGAKCSWMSFCPSSKIIKNQVNRDLIRTLKKWKLREIIQT